MSGSKDATLRSIPETGIKSDLAKVDAHEITQEEYDEIPELTDEMIARSEFYVDGKFVRMGFPGSPQWPVRITLRTEVVDHFRATGPGWQARVDAILMEAVRRERAEKSKG